MSLKKYAEKRNFKRTPEPKGKTAKHGKTLSFVVQRHDASHLHYDFRLEMEGTLKSWAVPKGPSMNPEDKRLAMMVEDHPFEYRKFAGTIPEGNYGAGEVEIWDRGTYTAALNTNGTGDEKELLKELEAGNLKFIMNGTHLKGEFALVRLKNAKEKNAWLLIKKHDKYAKEKEYNIEKHKSLVARKKRAPVKKKADKKPVAHKVASPKPAQTKGREHVSNYIKPMLAKQTDKPFDNDEWIFEIKFDGYRAVAETGKQLKLYSRNGISFLSKYPEVTEALQKIKTPMVLDGEVVAMDKNNISSFQLLQNFEESDAPLYYYVFDILKLNQKDLTGLPVIERKRILAKALPKSPVIRYSDHIEGKGIDFFKLSKEKGLEGIMAKRADSTYTTGVRTSNWLKIKNHKGQEAIIAGFTEPRGSRKYFGALVLGVYDKNELTYCGHTGTGFDEKTLADLYKKLSILVQDTSPFKKRVKTNMPVKWVKPVLVCELKFTEMTKDGIMRHPVFMGLREDKKAKEVVDENKTNMETKTTSKKEKKPAENKKPVKKEGGKKDEGEIIIDKHAIKLTNQDKVYFPSDDITKGDVVNYYQSVAKYILPYLKDRPESLLRNPNGIDKPAFFQKNAGGEAPDWVKTKTMYSDSTKKDVEYILCNDKATLAYLNNLGCIELNPWNSRIQSSGKPDYFIIDIDPSPKNTFDEVIEVAQAVKKVLDKGKVIGFPKTSGATGLHIYVPVGAKYTYEQVRSFAELIASMAQELVPDISSLERGLKKRGDKIYIDYLQNSEGQTLASVYSVRPKPGATVSTPLEWKEVKKGISPKDFTIKNIVKRIEKKGDLFKGVLGKGIDMMKSLKALNKD